MKTQIDFTIPELRSNSPEDIRGYLYQLREKLYVALMLVSEQESQNQKTVQDVKDSISAPTQEQRQSSFNAIKDLIIKSADIVDAYYSEMTSNLSSTYVARSDFGTFTEQVDRLTTETAKNTTDIFTQNRTLDDLQNIIRDEFQAYIKTGILDDENNVGLEIGGKDSGAYKKWARFTQKKLSFYDENENELGYFARYVMHINTADIGIIRIGGYEISQNDDGSISGYWIGLGRKEDNEE